MSQANVQIAYYVWAPDSKTGDAAQKRQTVHREHAEYFEARRAEGSVQYGGAVLAQDVQLPITAMPEFAGSMMIIKAESLEVARSLVEQDPYYKAGVWDKDSIKVAPVISRT